MDAYMVVEEPVTAHSKLSLDVQAGLFAVAKKQFPLPAKQRQVSARSPGRRLEANTAKVSAQYCNRMVIDAAERGELQEAMTRMAKLRSDGLQPSSEAFNALVLELLRCKDLDGAEEWLGKASASALNPDLAGLEASAATYNSLVTSLAETGQLPKAEKYAREAQGRGLELDSGSYHALVRACLDIGESRRAHTWCVEMVDVGHKKPNKAMMKSMVWALTDAGNTLSANHWLKFMAEESSDLDHRTYEHLRAAHPLDIVPTGLSGEVGASIPPVVRPATVGGERRKVVVPVEASPKRSPKSQGSPRPAWLSSPRRSVKGMRLEPIVGTSQLQMPSKPDKKAAGGATQMAVHNWVSDQGTDNAWLERKGLGPPAAKTQ